MTTQSCHGEGEVRVLRGEMEGKHAIKGGTMFSAPSLVDGGDFRYCDIVNAGTSTIRGEITHHDYFDSVVQGPDPFSLAPGQGFVSSAAVGAYCKVTLTSGSAEKVRGVAICNWGSDRQYSVPIQWPSRRMRLESSVIEVGHHGASMRHEC